MSLVRMFLAPLGMVVLFVILMVLGFATTATGWVAVAMLCAWPLTFALFGWTLRSLKDSYQLIPKQGGARQAGRVRRAPDGSEVFS